MVFYTLLKSKVFKLELNFFMDIKECSIKFFFHFLLSLFKNVNFISCHIAVLRSVIKELKACSDVMAVKDTVNKFFSMRKR